MTEREKQMIEAYLPNPRDPELPEDEYYILDNADKVQQVFISEIYPDMKNDTMTYGVVLSKSRKCYRGGLGYDGSVYMHELYDNKEDCRDQTHIIYDDWERLRALQERDT